ncbi:hypothetical protein [Nonomuraea rubra]|uniref:hypothetical protein n=1 Tax=Nonomuraea rubra TaxID=46180 RepID=UPI0031EC6A13
MPTTRHAAAGHVRGQRRGALSLDQEQVRTHDQLRTPTGRAGGTLAPRPRLTRRSRKNGT